MIRFKTGIVKRTRNVIAEFIHENYPGMDLKEVPMLLDDVKTWFKFEYMKWDDDGEPKKDYTESKLFMSIGHPYTEFTEIKKVFCQDCSCSLNELGGKICNAPENKKANWLKPDALTKYPFQININNDCKWFKQKED